ncbi:hypothetical protein MASR2M54_12270 [Aliarcobacter cryaerophilus]
MSLIFMEKDFVHNNRIHGNGLKSFIKKSSLIIGMLPFSLFVIINFEINFFGLIFLMTILFIFLTSFINIFLCLGSGNLYTYNLVSIICFYLVYTDINIISFHEQILISTLFLMTIISIYKFYRGLKNESKNEDFSNALNFFKNSTLDRVMVIPFQLPDEIAYKTSKKVFWGGHGYGLLFLELLFPSFQSKVEKAIEDWNLGAIFLQKD